MRVALKTPLKLKHASSRPLLDSEKAMKGPSVKFTSPWLQLGRPRSTRQGAGAVPAIEGSHQVTLPKATSFLPENPRLQEAFQLPRLSSLISSAFSVCTHAAPVYHQHGSLGSAHQDLHILGSHLSASKLASAPRTRAAKHA